MSDDRHVQAALRRLEIVCRDRPELQPLGQIDAQLIRALFAPRATDATSPATDEIPTAANDLAPNVPLFRAAPPRIDGDELRRDWMVVCEILAQSSEPDPVRRLAAAVTAGSIDPAEQLGAILSGETDSFQDVLRRLELDAPLAFTILRLSSLPLLEPLARRGQTLARPARWDRGDCPICGSEPLLAELRGLEQLRWLRCGWCAAQWQVDRLFCPFCGQRDHQRLRDLFVEGVEQGPRLAACDACGRSLPTLATLDALTAPGLLVAEMETLHLRFVVE